ncbi:PhzF family phenazine biosynthesis protein [Maribacter algarum]|uniref:PhzF family phenazine biosynthesis protein n=1 Tax=Maribacter algarum (ex Zhang et al. 2020) TaxID=2578118 RepID=A0A5S3PZM5_9FLAO|nr:PhzF family phenazine biosynthesis protein [Maribacter algarum]TMM58777.1 PhzF family phenazine biosynthesis protein [Maribacter algarum]
MQQIKFYIVDVFAIQKYAGNQLAVFVDLEQKLSDEQMLQMTREINFAESTFIRSIEDDGSFGVRIFTTEYEVPFAGHPTLGTAYILAKHLDKKRSTKIVLRLKVGDVPVTISNPQELEESRFTMQQAQPEFGASYSAETVSDAFDIPLDYFDVSMPIQDVNTGLPYLIIFLKDLESIGNLKLNPDKIEQFLKQEKLFKSNNPRGLTTNLFFVTRETAEKQNSYHTRMMVLEDASIWEDAATGSANGCFLAYLLKHDNPKQSVIVEQGFEMGRNSILYLDGAMKENEYILKVGGQVVPVSEGMWSI